MDYVYDPAGRLVARQDGNLRAAGRWILSKYDAFGEEVQQYLTGSNVFTFAGLTASFTDDAELSGVVAQNELAAMGAAGIVTDTYRFTYDAAGRLMTTARFTGTTGKTSSAAYTESRTTATERF